MWTPDPTWRRLSPTGDGSRVWRREVPGRGSWVGKRLVRPGLADVADGDLTAADHQSLDPAHASWWRREADVVEHRWAEGLPGVRGPAAGQVEEDDDGIVLWWPLVERPPAGDLDVASALGALASGGSGDAVGWGCRDLLGDRWRGVERSGGWRTVALTPAREVAEQLWRRRGGLLGAVGSLPRAPTHGDVTPGNVLGVGSAPTAGGSAERGTSQVVACDWSSAGSGPVGADLGYFTLSTRSRLEPLVDAYVGAAAAAGARLRVDDVLLGARTVMAFTVVTRLDRTLQRVADGEGDWSTKLRHPAVAPAVRALQRAYPDVAPVLD